MSKPYLIVNVVEGRLGVIKERPTWDEAVNCAVAMAQEQCNETEENIRKELERDKDFCNKDGTIWVSIAQAEE